MKAMKLTMTLIGTVMYASASAQTFWIPPRPMLPGPSYGPVLPPSAGGTPMYPPGVQPMPTFPRPPVQNWQQQPAPFLPPGGYPNYPAPIQPYSPPPPRVVCANGFCYMTR